MFTKPRHRTVRADMKKKKTGFRVFFLYVSMLGLLGVMLAFLAGYRQMAGPSMILLFSSLAVFAWVIL